MMNHQTWSQRWKSSRLGLRQRYLGYPALAEQWQWRRYRQLWDHYRRAKSRETISPSLNQINALVHTVGSLAPMAVAALWRDEKLPLPLLGALMELYHCVSR